MRVLEAAIQSGKPSHAYLFVGTRGTGKTSVARILARELGVSDKDLYEMDAASHTGVDNIRELREGVNMMPFESPYKFYIIDEAHMLSKGAWNAFLKTLEEPPEHAIFVLATTERDKVPDTIQSRCEIYTFKQPTREVLSKVITDIAKKEGYSMERGAAELVAMLAEGSFRDALSILQKVLTISTDKKVDVSEVMTVTGVPQSEVVRQILGSIAHDDVAAALAALQSAVQDNADMRVLTRFIIHRLRIALLLRYAPEIAENFSNELTGDDMAFVQGLSKQPRVNSEMLRTILEAYGQMAYSAVPYLPLELAIVDMAKNR